MLKRCSDDKKALKNLGIAGEVVTIRKAGVVGESDAVIIPAGESRTISKLIFPTTSRGKFCRL